MEIGAPALHPRIVRGALPVRAARRLSEDLVKKMLRLHEIRYRHR
jgi:hypothetical protein